MAMTLSRVPGGMDLEAENSGNPADLSWAPEIPLGARHVRAECNGRRVDARIEANPQDTHVMLRFRRPRAKATATSATGSYIDQRQRRSWLLGEQAKPSRSSPLYGPDHLTWRPTSFEYPAYDLRTYGTSKSRAKHREENNDLPGRVQAGSGPAAGRLRNGPAVSSISPRRNHHPIWTRK